MSSEMRELIAKWRDTADQCEERGLEACSIGLTVAANKADARADELRGCANELEALLARTEAGADGADMIQWRYTNAETGEVLTPWTECDAAFREKRKDAPGYQFRELFAHPQDASGDAVDWKDEYRFQRAMRYMDNNDELTKQRADEMADEDIRRIEAHAMQAKEAK